jgi:hypothetical protein
MSPLARSYPIPSPTHAGAMASASCRASPSAVPTTQRGNIQYPTPNVQYPSGARAWRQHLHPALTRAIGRSGVKSQAIVLIPGARPTWILDIGCWILDILFPCWSRILYWTLISWVVWLIRVKLKKLRMQAG